VNVLSLLWGLRSFPHVLYSISRYDIISVSMASRHVGPTKLSKKKGTTQAGSCPTREQEGGKICSRAIQELGEDVIVKYGHLSIAVLVYYASVHSLTIQRHRIVAAFVEDDDPTKATIPSKIFHACLGGGSN